MKMVPSFALCGKGKTTCEKSVKEITKTWEISKTGHQKRSIYNNSSETKCPCKFEFDIINNKKYI